MRSDIQTGNAELNSLETRGWLIGSFIEEKFGLRHSDDIELKWGILKAGDARAEWVTGETRTSIGILISGKFTMEFRDQSATFDKPGDYVMWGYDTDHRWNAPEDAIWLTIRWPSNDSAALMPKKSESKRQLMFVRHKYHLNSEQNIPRFKRIY